MNGADCTRYQLVAKATYLRLRLRYQLVDMSTYLAKPRLRRHATRAD